MPFFTPSPEDQGNREPMGQPPAPPVDPREVMDAAMRQGNSVVSTIQAIRNSRDFTPDPNHNPLDLIKGTPYEQHHLDLFVGSRSEAETRSIMGNIDRENNDRRILEGAGAPGVLAQFLAGTLDPTMALPAGIAANLGREGYVFGRAALRMGGAAALQAGAQEESSRPPRRLAH